MSKYKAIRAFRFAIAIVLFFAISYITKESAYFIAKITAYDVSEDVIRMVCLILNVLAYHSILTSFIKTDREARTTFCNGEKSKIKFMFCSYESLVSLIAYSLMYFIFPSAFAADALCGWLDIPYYLAFLIMLAVFTANLYLSWFA